MIDLAALKVKVDKKEIDAAKDSIKDLGKEIPGVSGAVDKLGGVFDKLKSPLTAVIGLLGLAAAAYVKLGISAIDAADELDNMSVATGHSVENLQAYEAVIALTSGSLDSYLTMLDKVSVKMAKTDGVDAFSQALKYFDVSLNDANGTMKSAEQLSAEVAKRYSELPVTVDSVAAATEILSKNYKENIEAAREMADKQEYLNEKLGLGAIVSKEAAAEAAEYKDQTTKLGWAIDGLANDAMADLLPILKATVDLLVDGAKASREFSKWLNEMRPGATKLSASLSTLNGPLGKAVELLQLYVKLKGMAEAQKPYDIDELMKPPPNTASSPKPPGTFNPDADIDAREAEAKAAKAESERERKAKEHQRNLLQIKKDAITLNNDIFDEMMRVEDDRIAIQEHNAGLQGKEIKRLDDLARKYKDLIDPLQQYRDKEAEIIELYESGRLNVDEYTEALFLNAEAMQNAAFKGDELVDKQKTGWESLQQAIEGYTQKMSEAFYDFATGAEGSFKGLVASMLEQLARLLMNEAFKKMMGGFGSADSAGTGLLGMIGGLFTSSNGNAFENGMPVTQHANGGIVSSPTMFGMPNGGLGSMAETEPEAIMPLKRMASGRLGVETTGFGGSTTINNVTINVEEGKDSNETAAKVKQATLDAMKQVADQRIMNSRRSGGLLNTMAASAY